MILDDTSLKIARAHYRLTAAERPAWAPLLMAMAEEPLATVDDVEALAYTLDCLDRVTRAVASGSPIKLADMPAFDPYDPALFPLFIRGAIPAIEARVTYAIWTWRRVALSTGWAWMRPAILAYLRGDLPSARLVATADLRFLLPLGALFRMPPRHEESPGDHRDRIELEAARREIDAALAADAAPGREVRAKAVRALAEEQFLTGDEAAFLLGILRWAATQPESPVDLARNKGGQLWAEIERLVEHPHLGWLELAITGLCAGWVPGHG